MEMSEIDGELICELYDVMPESIQDQIRLAAGALLWRRSVGMMAERHPEAFAAREFAWTLMTERGEKTLRRARDEIAEAGGIIQSAGWLVGAFESAKTREEMRLR